MSPATKSAAKKSAAHAKSAPRTAPAGEREETHSARMDRINAETRVDNAAQASATEEPPATQQATEGNRSEPQHAEHPESATDSTVRHSEPATGKQAGEGAGGFPTGEYDVTSPAPRAAEQFRDAFDAHFAGADVDRLQELMEDAVLDDGEIPLVLAACPVGFTLIKEGPDRWRAHVAGTQRFGHGQTPIAALEAFVTGTSSGTVYDQAAREFLKLPKADQDAIRERDRAARAAVSGQGGVETDPVEASRQTMAKRQGARLPAPGANDGAEQASASQNTTRAAKQAASGSKQAAKRKR